MQIAWFFHYFGVRLYCSWGCGTANSLLGEHCCLLSHQLKKRVFFTNTWHEKKQEPKIISVLLTSGKDLCEVMCEAFFFFFPWGGIKEILSRALGLEVSVASISSLFSVLTPKEYMTQYLKKKKKVKGSPWGQYQKRGNLFFSPRSYLPLFWTLYHSLLELWIILYSVTSPLADGYTPLVLLNQE